MTFEPELRLQIPFKSLFGIKYQYLTYKNDL